MSNTDKMSRAHAAAVISRFQDYLKGYLKDYFKVISRFLLAQQDYWYLWDRYINAYDQYVLGKYFELVVVYFLLLIYFFNLKAVLPLKLDPVWNRFPQKRQDIKEPNKNEVWGLPW